MYIRQAIERLGGIRVCAELKHSELNLEQIYRCGVSSATNMFTTVILFVYSTHSNLLMVVMSFDLWSIFTEGIVIIYTHNKCINKSY